MKRTLAEYARACGGELIGAADDVRDAVAAARGRDEVGLQRALARRGKDVGDQIFGPDGDARPR